MWTEIGRFVFREGNFRKRLANAEFLERPLKAGDEFWKLRWPRFAGKKIEIWMDTLADPKISLAELCVLRLLLPKRVHRSVLILKSFFSKSSSALDPWSPPQTTTTALAKEQWSLFLDVLLVNVLIGRPVQAAGV